MARFAVLLRGINLGRSRRVSMAELRAFLEEQGYGDPRTLLQSGNVVLDAGTAPVSLGAALSERFGMPIEVVLRDRESVARGRVESAR